ADEGEAALDLLAVRSGATGKRLPGPLWQPLRERAHRLWLPVGSGDRPTPPDTAPSFRHREGRLRPIDTDLGRDGEHVLKLARMQPRPKRAVVAVGAVGEDRRVRDLPARRLLDQSVRQPRL